MANLIRPETRRVSIMPPFAAALLSAGAAIAQETPTTGTGQPPPTLESGLSLDLSVVARQLDIARSEIQPSLGATVYDFSRQAIETQPQGDNAPFNQLLLQAPGCRPGFVRPAACARRPCQSAIPHQRSSVAGRDQCLRAVAADPARQFGGVDHRCAAGTIRAAHRGGHRHPDQDRYHQPRRLGDDVWRLAVDDLPECRMGRPRRPDRLLCDRRIPAKFSGESRTRRLPATPSTTIPSNPKGLPTFRGSSIRPRG